MTTHEARLKRIKELPAGFCLAKWYQVTIDLSRGLTHSCHHPMRHPVPIQELEKSPLALHNTEYKMEQRKKMLEGERLAECEYCWNIEDISADNLSDRYIKSTDDWAFENLDNALTMPWDSLVLPTYLEVMFSSDCNMNCMYCMADASSSIYQEMEKYGPYPVSVKWHRMPKNAPVSSEIYKESFWKMLPIINKSLKFFRITGGEPVLSQDTFKLLEFFAANPNKNLEVAINTNLNYTNQQTERLISHLKSLMAQKAILHSSIYTSIDGFGEQAAYMRKGLNFERFLANIEIIITSLPDAEIVLMCAFNILSVYSFNKLIEWVESKKKSGAKIILDISYLKDPGYLRANLLDKENYHYLSSCLERMKNSSFFSTYEVQKFERVINWILSTKLDNDLINLRADFYSFINEFDKRFNLNFNAVFPEATSFYQVTKKSKLWTSGNG